MRKELKNKHDLIADTREYLANADFETYLPNRLMCKFADLFDTEKFNWEKCSYYVAEYCPEHFDSEKFNWEKYSNYVAQYCPQFMKYQPK